MGSLLIQKEEQYFNSFWNETFANSESGTITLILDSFIRQVNIRIPI